MNLALFKFVQLGDNVVDTWSYYKNGLEVYRDGDLNFNGKADQYRWFHTGGSRWGLDKNEDGKLDASDIKSLYLSEVSGKRFTKVSTDFLELIDWNLIEPENRLYFRTIEDANKNGEFDKNDLMHYHFIDLSGKDWKVSDYKPV